MLIGIPKEIKNNENRVGLTPAGVQSLVKKGHQVLVETNAGLGSGFADEDYAKQGATIVATAAEAWAAEMDSTEEYLAQFGDKVPAEITAQLAKFRERIAAAK